VGIRRPVAPESVVEHVATSLARFKKPRRIRFVEAFAKTTAGKVRRGEARNRLGRAE
jgi:acyl-CoA synthetase (AMP-forming)/AMP-acid ligase II